MSSLIRQDREMTGLQHVTEVPHGLLDFQDLHVVRAVFLLCLAQVPGAEGERLSDILTSLLEDGTNDYG
jgi:hypothetical protein